MLAGEPPQRFDDILCETEANRRDTPRRSIFTMVRRKFFGIIGGNNTLRANDQAYKPTTKPGLTGGHCGNRKERTPGYQVGGLVGIVDLLVHAVLHIDGPLPAEKKARQDKGGGLVSKKWGWSKPSSQQAHSAREKNRAMSGRQLLSFRVRYRRSTRRSQAPHELNNANVLLVYLAIIISETAAAGHSHRRQNAERTGLRTLSQSARSHAPT